MSELDSIYVLNFKRRVVSAVLQGGNISHLWENPINRCSRDVAHTIENYR